MRKRNWKKILLRAFWLLAGIGVMVLLGAAMQKKSLKKCTDIKIEIVGESQHLFIDEKDVMDILNTSQLPKGMSISAINLRVLESMVEKNPWVLNAEMYIDNNQVLQVRIAERQPVARVFTLQGNSFYLDSGAMRLPLSEKLSARVPIFTGFPSDKEVLARPDSLLLKSIVKMGEYVVADSFWMAQISQLDITPQGGFEIVPVIGDHIVVFGAAEDINKKFDKLLSFYQKAWLQNGINTYEKLDIQYDQQVVAVKKGVGKALVDSLKAMQLLQGMLINNTMILNDSAAASEMRRAVLLSATTDSGANATKAIAVKKTLDKAGSINQKNNKMAVKPLSKGTKQKLLDQQKKQNPSQAKLNQPKAVMEKNKTTDNN